MKVQNQTTETAIAHLYKMFDRTIPAAFAGPTSTRILTS